MRLSKVARELNVGIQTIAEYLEGRGVEIEAKPNSKIEPDVYTMLEQAFQKDAAVKEKSEAISNRQRYMRSSKVDSNRSKLSPNAPIGCPHPCASP